MKTTAKPTPKKGRAKTASPDATLPKKRGRPALKLTDEERAVRYAEQHRAAMDKLRARVHYVSVPLEKTMLDWIEEERKNSQSIPMPGMARQIVMILEQHFLEGKPKKKRTKA